MYGTPVAAGVTAGSLEAFNGTSKPEDANNFNITGSSQIQFSTSDLLLVALLIAVIFISIVGNCLVCVAIFTDRRLRKLGNAFIVSLAIADLFVSCLVMTFALCNDLMNYWMFGNWFCDVWISFDIMCSTASILNLCAISLDRFIHIKDCLLYNQWMTRKVAISAVIIIWFISALVSFVPITLGWHKPGVVIDAKQSGLDKQAEPSRAEVARALNKRAADAAGGFQQQQVNNARDTTNKATLGSPEGFPGLRLLGAKLNYSSSSSGGGGGGGPTIQQSGAQIIVSGPSRPHLGATAAIENQSTRGSPSGPASPISESPQTRMEPGRKNQRADFVTLPANDSASESLLAGSSSASLRLLLRGPTNEDGFQGAGGDKGRQRRGIAGQANGSQQFNQVESNPHDGSQVEPSNKRRSWLKPESSSDETLTWVNQHHRTNMASSITAALVQQQTANLQLPEAPIPANQLPSCTLILTPSYAIISSSISFYIPCIIMLGLYTKLFICARKHVRNIQAISKAPAPISLTYSRGSSSEPAVAAASGLNLSGPLKRTWLKFGNNLKAKNKTINAQSQPQQTDKILTTSRKLLASTGSGGILAKQSAPPQGGLTNKISFGGNDTGQLTDQEDSEEASFLGQVNKLSREPEQLHTGRPHQSVAALQQSISNSSQNDNSPQIPQHHQHHQHHRHHQQRQQQQQQQQQSRQMATHKAAMTLGIIMGTFLFCWVPFFCLNIIKAFCTDCIDASVFRAFTWLGYANSALNPIIYGIHNSEFRQAFHRIFFKHFNIKNSRYYTNRSSYDLRVNNNRHNASRINKQISGQNKETFPAKTTNKIAVGGFPMGPPPSEPMSCGPDLQPEILPLNAGESLMCAGGDF